MTTARLGVPDLGMGVGFRVPHYDRVLAERPPIDWFEIISENFMVDGGEALAKLDALRAAYPVVPHGIGCNLGSTDPLDRDYLRRLRALVDRLRPPWASDHLCWTGAGGVSLHDLLPLPFTRATAEHVADRIAEVQDSLGLRFAVENASSYMTFTDDEMPEWEFLTLVVERADCGILLDVNNVYVSGHNHGFDPVTYLENVPHHRVVQMHLAGHLDRGRYLLDTHSTRVCDEVWELYRLACKRTGPVSTLIEWDDDIPELEVLIEEAELARAARTEALS